jgi:hypothetical protein
MGASRVAADASAAVVSSDEATGLSSASPGLTTGATGASDGLPPSAAATRRESAPNQSQARARNARSRGWSLPVTDGSFESPGSQRKLSESLARPAGLEPATRGLEGRCSIQLSYGRSLAKATPLYHADPVSAQAAPVRSCSPFALPCGCPLPPPGHTDPLGRALDDAVAGRRDALYTLLARGSHLPGTRINAALADAFAHACRARGAPADAVILALARLTPDEAPGATPLEFLPVCGIFALGARAATDETVRDRFVTELHAHADDARFRARDAVVQSLARVGSAAGDELLRHVASWMDGYFHAAAVLRALTQKGWLGGIHDSAAAVARLEEAFALVQHAPRAAARWPGHKELLLALGEAGAALATRFGVPVFDLLVRWSTSSDPAIRETVERTIAAPKLAGRFGPEAARVRAALAAALPPPRNPDHNVGPTRDRSHARRRRG